MPKGRFFKVKPTTLMILDKIAQQRSDVRADGHLDCHKKQFCVNLAGHTKAEKLFSNLCEVCFSSCANAEH